VKNREAFERRAMTSRTTIRAPGNTSHEIRSMRRNTIFLGDNANYSREFVDRDTTDLFRTFFITCD
jgi:hypothetical protein